MSVFFDSSIIAFYVSLIGIISMIGIKSRELKSGKKSFISRLSEYTNHIIHDYHARVIVFIKYINRKSALALVQWIAYHVLTWARNLYIWAYRKAHAHAPSKKVIDMVRGKGEIKRNTGSSFYLKSISGNDPEEFAEMKK